MSALAVLKAWLSGGLPTSLLPHLKLDHWTAWKDDHALGPVTSAKLGLKEGRQFWCAFTVTADGESRTVTAERPLSGGGATITVDGQELPGHVAFTTHLHGFPPEVKIEIDIVTISVGRYRFDAVVED